MTAKKGEKKAKKAPAGKKAAAENTGVLKLDKTLSIQGVGALKEQLNATLESDSPVHIDAGCVESADTAALQLLLAFARHNEAQSAPIVWDNTSDQFIESARLLDLDKHLGIGPGAA